MSTLPFMRIFSYSSEGINQGGIIHDNNFLPLKFERLTDVDTFNLSMVWSLTPFYQTFEMIYLLSFQSMILWEVLSCEGKL